MGTFEESIKELVEANQDEKLWELYLHSFPKVSFKEWKQEVLKESKPQKGMTDKEIMTQVKKAENLLSMMKGGQA